MVAGAVSEQEADGERRAGGDLPVHPSGGRQTPVRSAGWLRQSNALAAMKAASKKANQNRKKT
jgi:hypothetical protein